MKKPWLIAFGAGVVVIALVFWLKRGSGGDDKADASAPQQAQGSGAAIKVERDRNGEIRVVDTQRRVSLDEDPRGALRLEGQVVDGDDHPAAGATVVLSSNPPRTATTETDGSFAFDGLVGRPYTLIARGKDGVAGPITAKLTAKSDPVILRLKAGGKLTVTVTGTDGKPLDATVELRGTLDDLRETTTNGVATFKPVVLGGYQVAAWAEGKARSFQWIQIGAGDAEAKLVLQNGAAVSGRVVDEAGAAIAGARVQFSGASDWTQQGGDRVDAVETGADGSFAFAALPAGSFRFIASHADHATGTSPMVTLDGATKRDGVTITMGAGATLRGKVVDSAKNPVVSARVRVGIAAGPRTMIWDAPRQAYTDAEGAFVLRGLPRRQLAAVALHESGASQTVTVDAGNGDAEITLAIDVTGTISGIVVDPHGQPVEGVQVVAGPNFGDNRQEIDFQQWRLRGQPRELTDGSGKFTLTGLAPGNYMVSATASHSVGRREGATFGTPAKTGDTNLKIVLAPEGAVKGQVAFADGGAPDMFSVSVGMTGQSFAGGSFVLDALPPQKYEVTIRGPGFQTRVVEAVVESGKTTDLGTVTVTKGRTIAGVVVSDGQPVAGAKVHAGRIVFGNGTSGDANFGPMGASTKHDTTDANGAFSISGFSDGDITVVAEHDTLGRSRSVRLPTVMPGQTELTLVLEKFGSLSGTVKTGGKPAEGTLVSVQSTTSPGAIFGVAVGADGSFSYDRLAPDTYRVSATLGNPMTGMRFYSKQVEVPSGRAVTVDLTYDPGAVALEVTLQPKNGALGVAHAFLSSVPVTAKTYSELQLKLAAAGPSASQWVIIRNGEPARFDQIAPGPYTVCGSPFPAEVRGFAAMGYGERHGDTLPAFCQAVTVTAAAKQVATLPVELPPFVPDAPPPGGGSGSGGPPGGGSGSGH